MQGDDFDGAVYENGDDYEDPSDAWGRTPPLRRSTAGEGGDSRHGVGEAAPAVESAAAVPAAAELAAAAAAEAARAAEIAARRKYRAVMELGAFFGTHVVSSGTQEALLKLLHDPAFDPKALPPTLYLFNKALDAASAARAGDFDGTNLKALESGAIVALKLETAGLGLPTGAELFFYMKNLRVALNDVLRAEVADALVLDPAPLTRAMDGGEDGIPRQERGFNGPGKPLSWALATIERVCVCVSAPSNRKRTRKLFTKDKDQIMLKYLIHLYYE